MPTTRDHAITCAAPLLHDVRDEFAREPATMRAVGQMIVEGTEAAFFGGAPFVGRPEEQDGRVAEWPCGCRWYIVGPHVVAFLSCGHDASGTVGNRPRRRTAYATCAPTTLN